MERGSTPKMALSAVSVADVVRAKLAALLFQEETAQGGKTLVDRLQHIHATLPAHEQKNPFITLNRIESGILQKKEKEFNTLWFWYMQSSLVVASDFEW